MSQSASVWLVIVLAVVAANLPFVSHHFMALVPLARGKNLGLRGGELLLFYLLVGGIGLGLERHLGQIASQDWEFYAVTGALFLTLAFPGFVWRYLLKHRR